jgi:hypothetical protein
METAVTAVEKRLLSFARAGRVPNIILQGPPGSGKRTALRKLLEAVYKGDAARMRECIMYVDCAEGRGIKFVREELKQFAQAHVDVGREGAFKSIVMLNGDLLTPDAQSALRRCIEVFSHSTRFFLVVVDRCRLLRPILSRFCQIHCARPEGRGGKEINLHRAAVDDRLLPDPRMAARRRWLSRRLTKDPRAAGWELRAAADLYERAFSGADLIAYAETLPIAPRSKASLRLELGRAIGLVQDERLLMAYLLSRLTGQRRADDGSVR